ncbi:MAG: PRD domain-containing protein, partial [Spiroplasma sp.]|nr:PRD domain-containing protein [Mycoplasmatales bacterium]
KYSIVLTEDNGSMLITHIAMAHMRSKKKEPVTKLDEVIVNQLKVSKQYDDAIVCVEEINEILNGVLPEEEVEYVLMHVLNLLEKE